MFIPEEPSRVPSVLRPSAHTAALIHALHLDKERILNAHTLEMGSGSGVVLAALARLGAASLCGIDVEPDAVAAGTLLLQDLGYGSRSQVHHGSLWQPVAGRRFDLIVANLPHFALKDDEVHGRYPTWSAGGQDGRRLLNPFLTGLGDHLAVKGRAILTHNGFVGLDLSREIVAAQGLALRVVTSVLVVIDQEKLALMTPSLLRAEKGKSIHLYGPYAFADMHIVEISTKDWDSYVG